MSLWRALLGAWRGWLAIVRGEPEWRGHFKLTGPGIVSALALFLLAAFISIVLSALNFGVPTLDEFLGIMLALSLSLVALVLSAVATRYAVRTPASLIDLLVPGIYALGTYLIAGTLLSLVSSVLIVALWVGFAYLFYRLGRVAAGWTQGVSAAFGCLTVVLLAALPMTI